MATKKQTIKEVQQAIIEDVSDYYAFYQKPVKASDIGKRSGKKLKAVGLTVVSLLRDMHKEKQIALLMADNMTRYVIPYKAWDEMSKEDQFLFCNRLDQRNHDKINAANGEVTEKPEIRPDTYF